MSTKRVRGYPDTGLRITGYPYVCACLGASVVATADATLLALPSISAAVVDSVVDLGNKGAAERRPAGDEAGMRRADAKRECTRACFGMFLELNFPCLQRSDSYRTGYRAPWAAVRLTP